MHYRTANLANLPRLLELEQLVIEAERPFNASMKAGNITYYDIEHLISDGDSYLIVAEESNDIVGTGYARIRQSKNTLEHKIHAYLGFMYVSTNFRRRGINKKILELLIEWSKKKGAPNVYLEVYAKNSSAIQAYRKAGFEDCVVEMQLTV